MATTKTKTTKRGSRKKSVETWTMTLKRREKDNPVVKPKIDSATYLTCPHCDRIIFMAEPELTGSLRRWRDEAVKEFVKLEKSKKKYNK